jgi:hypothetical protein
MNLDELSAMECTFENCASFSSNPEPAEILAFMEQHEGEFIHARTREKHPDPVSAANNDLKSTGAWYSVPYRQAALQPDVYDYFHASERGQDPLARPGAGSLSYFPDTRTLKLGQCSGFGVTDPERPAKIEGVAAGLLQFIYHFAPLLQAEYGFVEAFEGDSRTHPGKEYRESGDVAYLCWANYFGPDLVERVGGEFLRQGPCWRAVMPPGGGILCVMTEKLLDWRFGKHRGAVEYFRQKFPDIEEL